MTIIWCVGSETEHNRQIFCHFRPFFALLPPTDLENQNFEKMEKKKMPEDILILQMRTIKENPMMYGSWDVEHGRDIFLECWTIFYPFTPLITP